MSRKLTKSTHDRKIAGVCGGLAEYFEIDSTIVRVAWVLLSILSTGFPGLILYVILAFVMPDH
ncbi:MAG: hypothetical protein COV99_07845 [Bacteroidetes bacterium CG12_big_fil_rev_8_21_14_0_65_60_17]|nr:MAG: hypothetical protein COV99_07845 [Bacteroidetes bacterium CG12_big_fil_rev_8_21_14_0_65_60_17]